MNRHEMMNLAAMGATVALMPDGTLARPADLLAPTPPMGWNSWNSSATTITEASALEQATIMARELRPAGYDIFTVDL